MDIGQNYDVVPVTAVHIFLPESRTKNLYAYATVELSGSFVIHDVQIYKGPHGLAVAMPERTHDRKCWSCSCRISQHDRWCGRCGERQSIVPKEDIRYKDICHPITYNQRREIDSAVLEAYRAKIGTARGSRTG